MLRFISEPEARLTKANKASLWDDFVNYRPLTHSAQAKTASFILNKAIEEGIPFALEGGSKMGFLIKRLDLKVRMEQAQKVMRGNGASDG